MLFKVLENQVVNAGFFKVLENRTADVSLFREQN